MNHIRWWSREIKINVNITKDNFKKYLQARTNENYNDDKGQ